MGSKGVSRIFQHLRCLKGSPNHLETPKVILPSLTFLDILLIYLHMKADFSSLSDLYISGVANPFVDIHVGTERGGGGLPGHMVGTSLGKYQKCALNVYIKTKNIYFFS